MDDIYVHEYRSNGQSFVTLVDSNICPVNAYISNYINIALNGTAYNTKVKYAHELKFVLKHFSTLKPHVDLVKRVKEGVFLNRGEVNGFIASVRFMNNSEFNNVINIEKRTDKALENAIHASKVANSSVNANTAKGRIRRLAHFLKFIFHEIHSDFSVQENIVERHERLQLAFADTISSLKDFETICVGFSESVIPNDVFFKLLEIIQPDSSNNPFKHYKLRNYLLIALFLETGLRRGAVAKLKIENLKFWGSFDEILVTRSPDDPTDSRSKRAHQKTQAHRSFCPPELMRQVKYYIDNIRSRFPKADTHDFVFIAEMNSQGTAGQPLSLSSYNQIFKILSDALGFRVHPHLIRHKWNEIFTDKGKEQNMGWDELDKLRKYAMGWVRDSNMSAIYNDFKTAEAVRDIQRLRQDHSVNARKDHA